MKPEVGKATALESYDDIKKILEDFSELKEDK